MPINFDWRNLQQYAMPALGIVSLLVSAIIVIVSGVGDEYVKSSSQGPSSDNDANVMFQVVDQHGVPRFCHVLSTGSPHDFKARYTSPIGYYGVKADPGTTVTVAFDCKITEMGTQTAQASAVAPETGVVRQKVVIPNPDSLSSKLSSSSSDENNEEDE